MNRDNGAYIRRRDSNIDLDRRLCCACGIMRRAKSRSTALNRHKSVSLFCWLTVFLQLYMGEKVASLSIRSPFLPRKCLNPRPARQMPTMVAASIDADAVAPIIQSVDSTDPHQQPKISKFASILAGEASSPGASSEWPPVDFSLGNSNGHPTAEEKSSRIAVLPLHERRELHYLRSLLSPTEVSSILRALQSSASADAGFQERDSRCLVAIEDGDPQPNDLTPILIPMLKNKILPFAKDVCGSHEMVVADALVRSCKSCQQPRVGSNPP
jgi:hypothetical protein